MESTQNTVVFNGEIAKGQNIDMVKKNLSSMFKLTNQQIKESFSGKPLMVKDHVDYQTALKYKTAFEKAGTVCHIQPITKKSQEEVSQKKQKIITEKKQQQENIAHKKEKFQKLPICPKCGYQATSDQDPLITGRDGLGECPSCGIVVGKYLHAKTNQPETTGREKLREKSVKAKREAHNEAGGVRCIRCKAKAYKVYPIYECHIAKVEYHETSDTIETKTTYDGITQHQIGLCRSCQRRAENEKLAEMNSVFYWGTGGSIVCGILAGVMFLSDDNEIAMGGLFFAGWCIFSLYKLISSLITVIGIKEGRLNLTLPPIVAKPPKIRTFSKNS